MSIRIIPEEEFRRIQGANIDPFDRLAILADMNRVNTLASVKKAGSGHLGSSFSAMDIVTFLYYAEMNVTALGVDHPDRDIYFSSKGHDVPGLYAVLFSLGILPKEQFLGLRRIGGTCGHPDVSTAGIEANTGSLGMGISKGKGMAYAKKYLCHSGRVFVMTGDGELQEGQNYEALQTVVSQKVNNLTIIVDNNKVQSDRPVIEISPLGDVEAKLRAFGWHVERVDGHDLRKLHKIFKGLRDVQDRPKALIADTIKGCGVSFMEHPAALKAAGGLYRWHSGAPDDSAFEAGFLEIINRVQDRLRESKLAPLVLEEIPQEVKTGGGATREYVADAFGEALVEVARIRTDLVVLDADLAADCRLREFEKTFPERFIENGIAEQDMVSMAGGLALQGLLPVVNSFAAFLSSRANEQIYNNICENTRIIYVNHYSGLLPAGPGQSHQSIRDISLLGALPNMTILQPCNLSETRMALNYCVQDALDNCVLRLVIGPSPRMIELPPGYLLTPGRGVTLVKGTDAVIFSYGPVMLHEAMLAAELLRDKNFGLKVVNMPWLNKVDVPWLLQTVRFHKLVFVLEDHSTRGGLGNKILECFSEAGLLHGRCLKILGVDGLPACGTPQEALNYHGLHGNGVAQKVLESVGRSY